MCLALLERHSNAIELCPPCQTHSSPHLTQKSPLSTSLSSTSRLVPFNPAHSTRSEWLHTTTRFFTVTSDGCSVCQGQLCIHWSALSGVGVCVADISAKITICQLLAFPKEKDLLSAGEGSGSGYLEMCNKGSYQWRKAQALLGHVWKSPPREEGWVPWHWTTAKVLGSWQYTSPSAHLLLCPCWSLHKY